MGQFGSAQCAENPFLQEIKKQKQPPNSLFCRVLGGTLPKKAHGHRRASGWRHS